MVAKTVPLPNVRELFIPDDGCIILDCDLAQADAQVVAWEADDAELKAIFKDPTANLHQENARTIFGQHTGAFYKKAKAGVHATNYGASARALAIALGITVREAEVFQSRWFQAHPGIREWHRRTELQLMQTRRLSNRFGFFRYFFDRVSSILPVGLAWIPQSTVALTINHGLVAVDSQIPEIDLLIQVHDSLVMQVRKSELRSVLPRLKAALEVTIPYDDPLVIPVSIDASEKSWGDVKPISWETGEYLE